MRFSADTTRRRVAAGALVVALGATVSLGIPALADEYQSTGDTQGPDSRIAEDGSIIPEPEAAPEAEDAIESRAELEAIEKDLDPAGSPAVFVCADEGAFIMTVVQGEEAPPDAKINPNAGPVIELPDPCEGLDWVVGK